MNKNPRISFYNIPGERFDTQGRKYLVDIENKFSSLKFTGLNVNDVKSFLDGEEPKYISETQLTEKFLFSLSTDIDDILIMINDVVVKRYGNITVMKENDFKIMTSNL